MSDDEDWYKPNHPATPPRQAKPGERVFDGSTEQQLVEPKSDTSYRVISIPASVALILVKHRSTQNRERLLAGERGIHQPNPNRSLHEPHRLVAYDCVKARPEQPNRC